MFHCQYYWFHFIDHCTHHICRLVKISSPYLNVIIIVGAMFFYVDVILTGLDSNTVSLSTGDILCQVVLDFIQHIILDEHSK